MDPPIGSAHNPGDIYFNTTSKTMKVVSKEHRSWISVGPPKVFDDFTNSTLDVKKWAALCGGAGTAAILVNDGEIDGAIRLHSGGLAADTVTFSLGGNRCIQKGRLTVYRVKVRVGNVTPADGTRVRIILFHDGGFNAVGDWFGLELNVAASANWQKRTTVAGGAVGPVAPGQDTGIPAVAGTWYELTVAIDALGIAYFYINDVAVGQIAAAELTTDQLEPLAYVDDGTLAQGHAINVDLDYVYAYQ